MSFVTQPKIKCGDCKLFVPNKVGPVGLGTCPNRINRVTYNPSQLHAECLRYCIDFNKKEAC